jgi:hypothetical protein
MVEGFITDSPKGKLFDRLFDKRRDSWHAVIIPSQVLSGGWVSVLKPNKGELSMTIESHLYQLQKRHHALENELADAAQHPSVDDLQIAELKRRKLVLKDEIAKLRTTH